MSVKPIPEGFHTITPYLIIKDAADFIEFTKKAFGAKELYRMSYQDGKVMHAEVQLGDSRFMLSESTKENKQSQVMLHLYVENTDEIFKQAVNAGCTVIREPADQFYGDRSGGVRDKFGIDWWISTHIENVPPEEFKKREEEYKKKHA